MSARVVDVSAESVRSVSTERYRRPVPKEMETRWENFHVLDCHASSVYDSSL